MRQVQQHLAAQDEDVGEPVTLQEGPRTPPTLSPGDIPWGESFQALIYSSPRAMPLSTADSVAFETPSSGDITTTVPIPVSADLGASPSSSSPVTSVFDTSGATSVTSWTSSTSSFPAPGDFRSPEETIRGFSSDPGRVTASVTTDANDLSLAARDSSRSAPEGSFNEQPPLADDFLQADAPLRARRDQNRGHSGTTPSYHALGRSHHSEPVHRFRTQHVSGSRSAPSLHGPQLATNPLASPAARDSLLQYAHQLYLPSNDGLPTGLSPVPIEAASSSGPPQSQRQVYISQLVPLLEGLRAIHPHHIPTLLLYGCVLYAVQDYRSSIKINDEILLIDPDYVEAMCNMGTTLKALGRLQEAEQRWWNAIKIRPVYWDAIENLISTLCSTDSAPPRYDTALALCAYVSAHVAPTYIPGHLMTRLRHTCTDEGIFQGINSTQDHPLRLYEVWPRDIHKLQHMLFLATNLRHLGGIKGNAVADHLDVLNLSFRPPLSDNITREEGSEIAAHTAHGIILSACIIGILMTTPRNSPVIRTIALELGLADVAQLASLVSEYGQVSGSPAPIGSKRVGLVEAVQMSLTRIRHALINIGGGLLPTVLLLPSQASKLPQLLFGATMGRLPAIGTLHSDTDLRRITSTILLSLGKVYQESDAFGNALLCFYLAAGFHATAATYNNTGLLLSAIGTRHTALVTDENGHSRVVDGLALARAYYVHGLGMDPQNPHLLTNLGSLMKELGQITEATQFYERALQVKPDFHVALANLANAMKDMGRGSEAVNYYRRALEISPDFAEALCGYIGALNSVCDWRGRGALPGPVQEHRNARFEPYVDSAGALRWLAHDASPSTGRGLMVRLSEVCEEQLQLGYSYGLGAMRSVATSHAWIEIIESALGHPLVGETRERWKKNIDRFFDASIDRRAKAINEGAFLITLASYLSRVIQRRWFVDAYGTKPFLNDSQPIPVPAATHVTPEHARLYQRLQLPASLGTPPIPSILPFHAFTYPLSVRTTRLLSYRNGLRITHLALTQPWISSHVSPPPPPHHRKLNIGYLSGDLNNHPLAHLMQSVFGFHDLTNYSTHVYATSPSDGSSYRKKIERDSEHFTDCSGWPTSKIVDKIIEDGIHVLINLGGYTKGCRNDIFAARPAPVQISVMGFAGTLSSGWSDYILTDVIACPPESCAFERWRQRRARGEETSRIQDHLKQLERETDMDVRPDPESLSEDWMYEKFIYVPHSYFVNDHKQAFSRDDLPHDTAVPNRTSDPDLLWALETARRWRLRQVLFPNVHEDTIIFANFNQLYKIDPVIFATWLRILQEVPNSILWLLRFPTLGAENLERTARQWAGESISSRIRFTDVAPKSHHIQRGRVADIFLDTPECNAHTTATDILWSGTPILTWPKYKHKMCSRVAASIARATGYGAQMTVGSLAEYQARAVFLAKTRTELLALRKALYFGRDSSPLFNTRAWTRFLEIGIREAWRRWVVGTEFEDSAEWAACDGPERDSSSIWISEDGRIVGPPKEFMP